jgi:ribonuclease HI
VKWNSNGWKNSKGEPVKNREAWERVLNAMEGIPIAFYHVLRSTAKYNKVVDEMAKKASRTQTTQE